MLHQQKYDTDILRRFHMADCNPTNTPTEVNIKLEIVEEEKAVDPTMYKQLVGSLSYLCNSRPDLSFDVGLISMFMTNPKKFHLVATKKNFEVCEGNIGIWYFVS